MNCDVVEATEGIGECAVTYVKRRKGWRMSYDVGEVMERENEPLRFECTINPQNLMKIFGAMF